MTKITKKTYINTTLDADLFRAFKVLAAKKNVRMNVLLEEAIKLLMEKYETEEHEK
jgi:hypothetical protein